MASLLFLLPTVIVVMRIFLRELFGSMPEATLPQQSSSRYFESAIEFRPRSKSAQTDEKD
jgi:hypothetical protein